MRTSFLAAFTLALAAPALAGRALLETAAAAAAPAPAPAGKAEATLAFGAGHATMKDGVLTLTHTTDEVQTTSGNLKTSEAFKAGNFDDKTSGDAVLTGIDTATDKPVKAVVRLVQPVYDNNKVTVKATPLAASTPAILEGGEVAKARADPATATDLPADVAFKLKDVKVVVDSLPATDAPADGEKHGIIGAAVGASVGNWVCGGSFVCSAVGAGIGYNG